MDGMVWHGMAWHGMAVVRTYTRMICFLRDQRHPKHDYEDASVRCS